MVSLCSGIVVLGSGFPGFRGVAYKRICIQQTHFIHKLWAPHPVITTGAYNRESGLKVAEETGQLVGYGALFLANVCSRSICCSNTQV